MSIICDITRYFFILTLNILVKTDKHLSQSAIAPPSPPVAAPACCQNAAVSDEVPLLAAKEDLFEQERIERWKEEVATKILKAIGRTKPPKVTPEDLQKFLPLADELRLERKSNSLHESSSNDKLKRKKIFVALNEALTSVGGTFPIEKEKFQDSEISEGELILKLQAAISPLSVLITNSWNSEEVKKDLPYQVVAHRIYLHPGFFGGIEDAKESKVTFLVTKINGFKVVEWRQRYWAPMATLKPYLAMSVETRSSVRSRRESSVRCKDQPSHMAGRCCVDDFEIDFQEMGYDFVIAPKSIKINRCRGSCDFRSPEKFANFGSILRALSPAGRAGGTRYHCCAPSRFSSMSVLYLDGENESSAKLSNIDDTIVESCYCV